jgi:hypothetical protein
MTAHGGKDERITAHGSDGSGNGPDDAGDVSDAATAGRDGDARPGRDSQFAGIELLGYGSLNIGNRLSVELLANFGELVVHRFYEKSREIGEFETGK